VRLVIRRLVLYDQPPFSFFRSIKSAERGEGPEMRRDACRSSRIVHRQSVVNQMIAVPSALTVSTFRPSREKLMKVTSRARAECERTSLPSGASRIHLRGTLSAAAGCYSVFLLNTESFASSSALRTFAILLICSTISHSRFQVTTP